MQPILDIRDLSFKTKARVLFQQLSMKVKPGVFIVISGPSGCGKSTLPQIIAGPEEATGGILLDEATGHLDQDNKTVFRQATRAFQQKNHTTTIGVTHNGEEITSADML